MGIEESAALIGALTETRVGPKRLSHRHEDIARWLLANPTESLGHCADYFGYTQAWLSCIIHSDAFQVKMRRMQAEADAVAVMDVPARLRGVAAMAIEGLGQQVEHALKPTEGNGVVHRQFLLDAADVTLKALGYGSKAPAAPAGGPTYIQQNNHFGPVSPAVLGAARERLLSLEVSPALPEASKLPAGDESRDGSVLGQTAALPSAPGAQGPETAGTDL